MEEVNLKTKREYEDHFKKLYKDFLRGERTIDDLLTANNDALTAFKANFPLDNKSIEFLPVYFNFIEFYLKKDKEKLSEVKKYLIVGLSNLLFSTKKRDDDSNDPDLDEDEDVKRQKNYLRSRMDFLFARYNLLTKKYDEAIDKLTASIITYSEIYGPESVGLTAHYFYLANYFSEIIDKDAEERDVIIMNIYLKITEIWKKYFLGDKNELFETLNVEHNLDLIEGEHYILKMQRARSILLIDKEIELKLKIIRTLILKELGLEYKEYLNQVFRLRDSLKDYSDPFYESLKDKLF